MMISIPPSSLDTSDRNTQSNETGICSPIHNGSGKGIFKADNEHNTNNKQHIFDISNNRYREIGTAQ